MIGNIIPGVVDTKISNTITATGGTIVTSGGYKYHTFTGNGNFVVSAIGGTPTFEVLQIAGGGGGSSGGGGAGGLRYFGAQTPTVTTYAITVGGGGALGSSGASNGTNGVDSQFAALTVSTGGGGGSQYGAPNSTNNGVAGGSGGGGSSRDSTGTGTGLV
jgi:hypothetical protein